ncbi:MAG: hypothetical protein C5S41_00480 [Candidatus Methanomarinus sp.]|nr:hypothetical protein C5S42_09545 [ANME-2 cluster archaeon]KAF5428217.1 MAG: hypothetical protein C5S41_00480 [ANME-2 cluster archaeon]
MSSQSYNVVKYISYIPHIQLEGINMKKYIVTLTKDERETLRALTSKGKHKSQKILNALILLGCDEGEYQIKRSTNEEISQILNISTAIPAKIVNACS